MNQLSFRRDLRIPVIANSLSLGITRWQHRAHAAAAAAAAAPELRAVAYAANLRRRYRSAAGPPGER